MWHALLGMGKLVAGVAGVIITSDTTVVSSVDDIACTISARAIFISATGSMITTDTSVIDDDAKCVTVTTATTILESA